MNTKILLIGNIRYKNAYTIYQNLAFQYLSTELYRQLTSRKSFIRTLPFLFCNFVNNRKIFISLVSEVSGLSERKMSSHFDFTLTTPLLSSLVTALFHQIPKFNQVQSMHPLLNFFLLIIIFFECHN